VGWEDTSLTSEFGKRGDVHLNYVSQFSVSTSNGVDE
jgi:hypothetical protein